LRGVSTQEVSMTRSLFPKKAVKSDENDNDNRSNELTEVTVTFRMDEGTAEMFRSFSIEDVISLSVGIVTKHFDREEAVVNAEAWDVCRPAVQLMWNAVRNGLHNDEVPPVTLRKGDVETGE
jgi:hypothetical protein